MGRIPHIITAIAIVAIAAVAPLGCDDLANLFGASDANAKANPKTTTDQPTSPRPFPGHADRPIDVVYTIINTTSSELDATHVDIRINRRVKTSVLNAIAEELIDIDANVYNDASINVFLPGTDTADAPWATMQLSTSPTQTKDITILGLTAERAKQLANEPDPTYRKTLGRWLVPLHAARATIYRTNNGPVLEWTHKDGERTTIDLNESPAEFGYEFTSANDPSTRWIITRLGDLEIHNTDTGKVTTSRERILWRGKDDASGSAAE